MKAVITQKLVEQVRREARERQTRIEVWDLHLKNFYLQVRSTGNASFFLRYVSPEHNQKRTLLIGDAASIGVDRARRKAKDLLAKVFHGEDPLETKKDKLACLTVEEAVCDWYLPHKADKTSCRNDASIFKYHVLPFIGKKKLSTVTPGDIASLQQRMVKSGYVAATCNRPVVLLKHLFNLSIRLWHLPGVTANPANEITLLKENSFRQTFLTEQQVSQLLGACATLEKCPNLAAIVAFMLLTGARKSNVLNARWNEIDWHARVWTIPKTKSGRFQSIPLSDEAVAILKAQQATATGPYIFPNVKTGQPYKNLFNRWSQARRQVGLEHVRMHDLRHTFASLLINSGCSLFVVQKALGHQNPQVTMRYAHLADSTLQDAAGKVGKMLKAGLLPFAA